MFLLLEDLKLLLKNVKYIDGILQEFVLPSERSNYSLCVTWTPSLHTIEKISSKFFLDDATDPNQKCVTFEGPEYLTQKVSPPSNQIQRRLIQFCQQINEHIIDVSESSQSIEKMTLFFRLDSRKRIFLLYTSGYSFVSAASSPNMTQSSSKPPSVILFKQKPLEMRHPEFFVSPMKTIERTKQREQILAAHQRSRTASRSTDRTLRRETITSISDDVLLSPVSASNSRMSTSPNHNSEGVRTRSFSMTNDEINKEDVSDASPKRRESRKRGRVSEEYYKQMSRPRSVTIGKEMYIKMKQKKESGEEPIQEEAGQRVIILNKDEVEKEKKMNVLERSIQRDRASTPNTATRAPYQNILTSTRNPIYGRRNAYPPSKATRPRTVSGDRSTGRNGRGAMGTSADETRMRQLHSRQSRNTQNGSMDEARRMADALNAEGIERMERRRRRDAEKKAREAVLTDLENGNSRQTCWSTSYSPSPQSLPS
ncbi:hypothetical protein BLNAU_10328 [Blattamonas nauphoetae]|uniref:Uncharacterized protein n=1 Tax=Blattamonas nauphoetae TaxID=2049346 RepID=A0ABQ9XT64_9EUKA|nr:hypothetical protein BLNAU_10328 [Blattamonas nauphoetae]